MKSARQRQFDVLLFYRFDRLTRAGILDTLAILRELAELGIEYESYSEPHIRSAGKLGELMVSIMATFAELERDINRERTRAGIARARQQGKQLGRPRVIAPRDRIAQLRAEHHSYSQIAKLTGLSKSTVARILNHAS